MGCLGPHSWEVGGQAPRFSSPLSPHLPLPDPRGCRGWGNQLRGGCYQVMGGRAPGPRGLQRGHQQGKGRLAVVQMGAVGGSRVTSQRDCGRGSRRDERGWVPGPGVLRQPPTTVRGPLGPARPLGTGPQHCLGWAGCVTWPPILAEMAQEPGWPCPHRAGPWAGQAELPFVLQTPGPLSPHTLASDSKGLPRDGAWGGRERKLLGVRRGPS